MYYACIADNTDWFYCDKTGVTSVVSDPSSRLLFFIYNTTNVHFYPELYC